MTTITLNNGVTGATLTQVGDAPFYAGKNHAFSSPSEVVELTSDFANTVSVKVEGHGVWNGQDVLVIAQNSDTDLHFRFGDPVTGTTVIHDYTSASGFDMMVDNPVVEGGKTYRFKPQRFFIVGDVMIAFCAVQNVTDGVTQRIAFLSTSMADIAAGTTSGWTVHAVSPIANASIDATGQFWACQQAYSADGMEFFAWSDYASDPGKAGGVSGIAGFTSAGVFDDAIVTDTYSYTSSHAHQPCLFATSAGHAMLSSRNDAVRYYGLRTITDLSTYADNAVVNAGSGLGTSYKMKDVSATDWSAEANAAGMTDPTPSAYNNSKFPNYFMLGAKPSDPTKVLVGCDLSDGIINQFSIDSNNKLYVENLFAPAARHISSDVGESANMFDLFCLARNGNHLAGVFFNELGASGSSVSELSGVVYSSDGGDTWSIVWRGTSASGLTGQSGIAVLQDGTIIVGSVDTNSSVRVITPGIATTVNPLRVGSRAPNLLSGAQVDVASWIASSGTSPELALPSFLHNENTFEVIRDETAGFGYITPCLSILTETAFRAHGCEYTYWTRRLDSAGSTIDDGLGINLLQKFHLSGTTWLSPNPEARQNAPALDRFANNDWVAHTVTIKGANLGLPSFAVDPGHIHQFNYGNGQAASISKVEIYFDRFSSNARRRPNFPGGARTDDGIASAKFEGIGSGSTDWTALAKIRIPDDCWDVWAGGSDDAWPSSVPIFTLTDGGSNGITFDALLSSAASGGGSVAYSGGSFTFGLWDSGNATRTTQAHIPLRGESLMIAISSNGNYAIGTPTGIVSGTRAGVPSFELDTLMLSGIDGVEVLEMDHAGYEFDGEARTTSELEAVVENGSIPASTVSGNRSRSRSRAR